MGNRCHPLGLTMGCPVGIGPEIILKFFVQQAQKGEYQPIVVLGDPEVLAYTAKRNGLTVNIVPWHPGQEVEQGTVSVYAASQLASDSIRPGHPDIRTGHAMVSYIHSAVRFIQDGVLSGMVTCPISKASLHNAGYRYPGHTEMLADLSGSKQIRMMMAADDFKVVLVTIHEPLARVSSLLSRQDIVDCISMTFSSLRSDFSCLDPRIGVAGLNPHGGEQGLFGREEHDIIAPAVAEWATMGKVSGPWPPDTVFARAAAGEFDAVVAMYHDQGLIPFKLLHFHDGVNVTLGLPFVRTSVDHGTAYDIVGQGKADPGSLQAAVRMAKLMIENRERISEQ